ncbi:MAG: type ISP restriction/modification enzyme [Prochlorotrichaceae cyanobacterium]
MTNIYHAHLYGTRSSKYDWLQNHDVLSTEWQEIKSQSPFYLLIPQNTDLLGEYEQGWKITEVMPVNSTGVKTHRDHFVIDFDREKLKTRISEFRDLEISDEEIKKRYILSDKAEWKLNLRRRSLSKNEEWKKSLISCLYRPFDIRAYYHHHDLVDRSRNEVMKHIIFNKNLGLVFMRQVAAQEGYNHFIATNLVVDNRSFYSNKGTMQIAPLYLYPDRSAINSDRRPNFSSEFLKDLTTKLGSTPTPESIFYYIYAVFHSPTYRSRYAEFLKIDFPRVPLTSTPDLFQQLATYGEELVALHLMKSAKLDTALTQFEGNADPVVDPGHPKYTQGTVKINKRGDAFTGVPEAVWNFYVGGYQVCHKWLKDRKGRTLSPEDINHYQRIVVALQETIDLMQKIDEAIPGWPLE